MTKREVQIRELKAFLQTRPEDQHIYFSLSADVNTMWPVRYKNEDIVVSYNPAIHALAISGVSRNEYKKLLHPTNPRTSDEPHNERSIVHTKLTEMNAGELLNVLRSDTIWYLYGNNLMSTTDYLVDLKKKCIRIHTKDINMPYLFKDYGASWWTNGEVAKAAYDKAMTEESEDITIEDLIKGVELLCRMF